MKALILSFICLQFFAFDISAQGVTQINSNKSLHLTAAISTTKTIFVSSLDSSIWVTDGTLIGTFQLSTNIKFENDLYILSGKVIFRGSTDTTGSELFISDGTIAGTKLVANIVAGATGSDPSDFTPLNDGFIYFTAKTPDEGRELWRTDGTAASLVKDINAGPGGTFNDTDVNLFSTGSYLLFAGNTPSAGIELYKSNGTSAGTDTLKDINPLGSSSNPNSFIQYNSNLVLFLATDADHGQELWKTDGTKPGTVLLKDINPLGDSSKPNHFFSYNNLLLFVATDAAHGEEIWKTDGTDVGTVIVKDINNGPSSSTSKEFFPGFGSPIFNGFHLFNNRVYFNATDGNSTGELWTSDGTDLNTVLVKDIISDNTSFVFPLVSPANAINLPSKFIFPVTDYSSRAELWESDGTLTGTHLFKSFSFTGFTSSPSIYSNLSFDPLTGNRTYPLFMGNKFFFAADTATKGRELWISDGVDSTPGHTHMVDDINPGNASAITPILFSYLYTTTNFFFAANDGTHGNELWQTDGTTASIVADINPNAGNANPFIPFLLNGKIIFNATDGVGAANATDLYVVNGTFTALPVKLSEFTVSLKAKDALLQWSTVSEINSKGFIVQRSYDGQHFEDIGNVPAANIFASKQDYSFVDADVVNSGKNIIYYRIISVDKNGKQENTNVIFIKIKGNINWSVTLLTNPVQSDATVMLNGISGTLQLYVRDLNGKTLYKTSRQNINGQISIPVAGLPHGMYVLVAEANNERKSIKFIKQ